jgi:translation elongation factor EF-Tu-like GTPase
VLILFRYWVVYVPSVDMNSEYAVTDVFTIQRRGIVLVIAAVRPPVMVGDTFDVFDGQGLIGSHVVKGVEIFQGDQGCMNDRIGLLIDGTEKSKFHVGQTVRRR